MLFTAALVAVLLVAGGMVLTAGGDDPPTPADPGAPQGGVGLSPDPAQTGAADVVPTGDPERDAVMVELAAFVEEERGLEFLHPVNVELVDDATFEARLMEDFEENLVEFEAANLVLQALRLAPPGTDLVSAMRGLMGEAVLGFYDPETDELVVRGTELTPYVRQTVVHELVHALDDQHFDLHRPELEEKLDESAFAFTALVEGIAVVVEEEYAASLSASERAELAAEEQRFADAMDLTGIPVILLELIGAPYVLGRYFVEEVIAQEGDLAQAFGAPPSTSEQILDPVRYLEGESAIPVQAPPVGGELVDEGVFGQLLMIATLAEVLAPEVAAEAMSGWGGDYYVAWSEGGRACVRIDIAMDDPGSLEAATEAFGDWAAGVGAEPPAGSSVVERPTPELLRVSSCA